MWQTEGLSLGRLPCSTTDLATSECVLRALIFCQISVDIAKDVHMADCLAD